MPTTLSQSAIVEIPLSQIRPNPQNPGPPIPEELIEDMAASVEANGLQNPIKVMADPLGEGKWLLLSGERRYRAFLKLKRETIPAYILNPSPQEAVIITHTDNDVRDRGWWAAYQSIELLKQADPNLTQRQIGAMLKVSLERVNWALRLLPLLNEASRDILVRNPNTGNKGNWGISEGAAARLADLGDPAQVEAALRKVVDGQMTEAQAKKLVAEMQSTVDGRQSAAPVKTATPKAVEPQGTQRSQSTAKAKAVEPPRHQGHQEGQAGEVGSPTSQALLGAVLGSTGIHRSQSHKAFSNSIKTWGLNLAIRSWKGMNQFYQRVGFKNPMVPTVITLFLFLVFVNGLPRQIERFVDNVVTSIRRTSLAVTPQSTVDSRQSAAPIESAQPKPVSQPVSVTKPEPAPVEKAPGPPIEATGSSKSEGNSQVAQSGVTAKGTDALKAIGDGVHDVSHAVNTADQGAQAVDAAKKLLGF